MGVFQKAFWNKCKTTPKNYNIPNTTSKKKSPNPPLGFLKNSNIENLANFFQINSKIS
jgi:hypothetical protein